MMASGTLQKRWNRVGKKAQTSSNRRSTVVVREIEVVEEVLVWIGNGIYSRVVLWWGWIVIGFEVEALAGMLASCSS
jgi:hypothetical protein